MVSIPYKVAIFFLKYVAFSSVDSSTSNIFVAMFILVEHIKLIVLILINSYKCMLSIYS